MNYAIVTTVDIEAGSGGPARSIPALCSALQATGIQITLVTHNYTNKKKPALETMFSIEFVNCWRGWERGLRWSPQFYARIIEVAKCFPLKETLLHDNGLWRLNNLSAARAAKTLGVPLILSPRGMLTPWALKHKWLKKTLGSWLYQRRCLSQVALFHATSKQEAEDLRRQGFRQPIAVIPNGVSLPKQRAESGKQKVESRTVLFLSRFHPVKGVLDLVKAWAGVEESGKQKAESRKLKSKWRVVLAGYDENGYSAELKAECRKLKVENDFEFIGPVEGEAKWDLYRNADLFVLPSYSENFGIVIAEALACGIPVITTRATPWQELESHRCGWWIPTGADALAIALQQAMALSDSAREEMGARGRELILSKYTWPAIGEEMKRVYEWILGMGGKPACIV